MDPEVVAAIPPLVADGILPAAAAPRLLRIARGELVSVRRELRGLLYLGVLMATAGVGLMVQQNLDRIGPVAIACALGLAAAAALGWVARVAPPFAWSEVQAPNLAFDYILLLGVLLGASELAYCEAEFGLLGSHRALHLLIVAVLAGWAAVRFDSRIVLSLALSTFAAWRGVSLAHGGLEIGGASGALRWNVLGCGVLFVALGRILKRTGRKPHFEPVAMHLGCLLLLGGLASGLFEADGAWVPWTLALLGAGAALAVAAYLARRFSLFAYGVLAVYAALSCLVLRTPGLQSLGCLWFPGSATLMIVVLILAQHQMRRKTP